MKISDFKKEKEKINDEIIDIFYDDEQEGTIYLLERYDRRLNDRPIATNVFRRYDDVKWAMRIARMESKCENNEDFCYWQLKKYLLVNDKFEEILSGLFSFSSKLIGFVSFHPLLEDINGRNNKLWNELECPFETGDVVKVQNVPFDDDVYAIYGMYEKNNKRYVLWRRNDGEVCSEYCSILKLEKVSHCSDEWIVETGKKIKNKPSFFSELIDTSTKLT